MIDASIVITSYNPGSFLEKCIDSIPEGAKGHSFEIIVVDDASSDNCAEQASKTHRGLILIKNPNNLGYVRSNNEGIQKASGRYVLCLNNDTVVQPEAIGKLIDLMEKRRDIGAIGPKLLNSDGSIQMQCRRSFPDPMNALYYFSGIGRLFPKSKRFNSYLLKHIDDSLAQEVDSLCGAAMMVRREVLDKVGSMEETYVMYGDDIDWCYRIKQAGWKIFYLPDAEIIHYGGMGGSRKQSYRNIFEFHRAMAIFHKKHYSGSYPLIVNWLVYTGIWLKCAFSLARNILRKTKFVGTKKP